MRFNDGLGDSQPQHGAAQFPTVGWVGAVGAVKNVGETFGRDTIAIIGDFHTDRLILLPQPQVNPTVGVAQPIPLQILQDLNYADSIPMDYHRLLRARCVQGEASS